MYMHARIINERRDMNLNEGKEGYIGGLEKRKGRGNDVITIIS